MSRLEKIGAWFGQRLQIGGAVRDAAAHPVPRKSASWWYVFGSAALTIFILQVFTGIMLALIYVPSAAEAWNSLQYLNHGVTLGWFLRAVHGWGSNFMVAVVLIHMCQVILFGAYKFPRELTWILGVFLLLMTLGMAFTGQIMRFDQDAYWGLGIGVAICGRVPLVGKQLVQMLMGGPIIAGDTLSRFFALHVFVIPGLIIGLVSLHLLLVLKLGINEWPMPGRLVRRSTYLKEYHELTHKDGIPFVPEAVWKDMFFSAAIIVSIMVCAAFFGPFGPEWIPGSDHRTNCPEAGFFLPVAVRTVLFASATDGDTNPHHWPHPRNRFPDLAAVHCWGRREELAAAAGCGCHIAVACGWSWHVHSTGKLCTWSPVMNAWSGDPVPVEYLNGRSPLERQGSLVFQVKQCRNCHSIGGSGGKRGPALDKVATTLTHDQLVRQVLQGGGNMPAYGKNLSPAEVTALVSFLETLHPPNRPPARDASQAAVQPQAAQPTPADR